jgi:hypothetical protein
MKAEHRKELQTNVLADRLGHFMQSMKEGPSRGTVLLIAAVVLIIGLGYTWRFLSRSSEKSDSERWVKWNEVTTPAELQGLLDNKDLEGTQQARLARFLAARKNLLEGTRDLAQEGKEHDDAVKNIREAAEQYEKLAGEVSDRPVLVQEALAGAARGRESLGEIDNARRLYERLAKEYPESYLGKDARKQLDRLDNKANSKDLEDLRSRYNTSSGR